MANTLPQEMKRFHYLTAEIDAAYHEAALRLGLSDSAMLILYTVCEHDGACPLSQITHLTGLCKQTVHSALRKLEQDGIIVLEQSSGRMKTVCLTERGREAAEHTVCKLLRIENKICGAWEPWEWELYMELTQRYLAAFKEEMKELPR